jgi:hypothetical protein
MVNHGTSKALTRRIIAEDSEWTLQTVPYLRQMALKVIIKNWDKLPYLEELPTEREKVEVLKKLDLELKLEMAILVDDQDYWKRRSVIRWPVLNVSNYRKE